MFQKYSPPRLTFALLITVIGLVACGEPAEALWGPEDRESFDVDVEHVLLDNLGGERMKNAAYRTTADGEERIVSWGFRILEWPLDHSGSRTEVVSETEGLWYSNGGTVMDVDKDGNDNLIVARDQVPGYAALDDVQYVGDLEHVELLWYKPVADAKTWEGHRIAVIQDGGSPHDIQHFTTRTSGGEAEGVLLSMGRQQLIWFEIPDDPESEWIRHDITTLPVSEQSGLTIADISGNGLPDILTGMFWIESPEDPTEGNWVPHRFGNWDESTRGGMNKHLFDDFDGDGQKDIIVVEAEIENARLGLFKQTEDPYDLWEVEVIDSTLYAPHSLVASDINGSGLKDLIVGEMTAGGWDYPLQENPKIYLFRNNGDIDFQKETLIEGWGVHEMKLVERADGTKMIYSADEIQPHKIEGMETHVSYWVLRPVTEDVAITGAMFQHHFITKEMPTGEDKSWGYGTPTMADFDNDGTLDFSFGVREDSIYWFEFKEWGDWIRHPVGPQPLRTLGATSIDVDGDGWTDIVTGRYWYRNPQNPRDNSFEMYEYDSRITSEIHDVVAADIDGDGRDEIIVLGDDEGLFWYKVPDDPKENKNWPRTTITMDVLNEHDDIHGGIAPRGIGDINGNGHADIVLPDRWLENLGGGTEWVSHDLPFGKAGPWGLSARSWIVDLNGNGSNDIIIADSDQKESRVAWLENKSGNPPVFEPHFLPMRASGTRGSFHSLAVADFNGNGALEIFAVEQEDESILPEGAPPRWYIWENVGEEEPVFIERVVFDGRLGGHDIRIGDVDGNGNIDICAKIWSRWTENANRGREHAGCLQNLGN